MLQNTTISLVVVHETMHFVYNAFISAHLLTVAGQFTHTANLLHDSSSELGGPNLH